jgi:transcriptional regulator with XRE-family HTH domain
MKTRGDEGEKLRREIGERRSTRGRLRRELRERCEEYAASQSAAGASHKAIAMALGVSAMSVQRWLRGKPKADALVRVRVASPRPAAVVARPVLTTPRGLRVEGLDLDALCLVLARLG